MTPSVGEKIGCMTVIEHVEAAQARLRDLRGYRGRPVHPEADGTHVLLRCDCLLEFLVRARELSRRKKLSRCGEKCELGKRGADLRLPEWTQCRNPLCGKELNVGGMGRPNLTGFCNPCKATPVVRHWYEATRPDAAKRLARRTKKDRQIRAARRAHGQCVQCGVPCEGRVCEPHRLANNENAELRRARLVRAGMCGDCKRVAAPGKSRCAKHLAADARRAAERYGRSKQEPGRIAA